MDGDGGSPSIVEDHGASKTRESCPGELKQSSTPLATQTHTQKHGVSMLQTKLKRHGSNVNMSTHPTF